MAKAKGQTKEEFNEIGMPKEEVKRYSSARFKSSEDWLKAYEKADRKEYRRLEIEIEFTGQLHAGKPAKLDTINAMLNARGLSEVAEAIELEKPIEKRVEQAEEAGVCEFHRRDGKPGIWMPANNIKAMFKENWSVLGYRVEYRGSRGALAEGVFVVSCDPKDRNWIYVGDSPAGIHENPCHTNGPSGPQSSIKRNEYVENARIKFQVEFAQEIAAKLPDEAFARMLAHAAKHGLGANRSQGMGTFKLVSVKEVG